MPISVVVDTGTEHHFSNVAISRIGIGELPVGLEQFEEGFLEDVIHAGWIGQNIANKRSKNGLILVPKPFQQRKKASQKRSTTL